MHILRTLLLTALLAAPASAFALQAVVPAPPPAPLPPLPPPSPLPPPPPLPPAPPAPPALHILPAPPPALIAARNEAARARDIERAARDKANAEAHRMRAAEREKRRLHREQFHKEEVPFALLRRDDGRQYTFMRSDGDVDAQAELRRAGQTMQGEILWFRHNGKSYFSNDPSVLARFKGALEPVEKIGRDMRELSKQMSAHNRTVSEIGRQMRSFQLDPKTRDAIHHIGREMGDLGRKQAYVSLDIARIDLRRGDAKDAAERARLQRELDEHRAKLDGLQQQMRKLEADMQQLTRTVEDAHKPLEALDKKMEEAVKPLEALGRQMEALGEQQDAAWHAAEPNFKAIFADAVASGKAVTL